jgi:hypothetical protein
MKTRVTRKQKLWIAISILLILLLVYSSDRLLFDYSGKLIDAAYRFTNNNKQTAFLLKLNLLSRLEYKLNPFAIKKDLSDGTLSVYDLRFSQNDMAHFKEISEEAKESGYLTENNTWRDAELKYNGKTYKIKAKLRGDLRNHWAGRLKSYGIKMEKEEDYINNFRSFNLFIYEDKFLRPKISDIISNYFGLYDLREELVVVKINGITQGVYYLQEDINQEFLEYNKCSSCQLFSIKDNYFEDHPFNADSGDLIPYGLFTGSGHLTNFDYEISNAEAGEGSLQNEEALQRLEEMFRVIREGDESRLLEFFDLDYISGIEALKVIIGNCHFLTGDNIEIVYSATNSKFYIVPRNEAMAYLQIEKGGFEHEVSMYKNSQSRFSALLTKNNQVRQLRNKKLYNYITTEDLISKVDELNKFYYPYTTSYETNFYSPRYSKFIITTDKKYFEENFKIIRQALEYSKLYINTFQQDNIIELEIIPDSLSQLKLTTLTLTLTQPYAGDITITARDLYNPNLTTTTHLTTPTTEINLAEEVFNLYFSATLDENLYPKQERYLVRIEFSKPVSLVSVQATALNDITSQPLSGNNLRIEKRSLTHILN